MTVYCFYSLTYSQRVYHSKYKVWLCVLCIAQYDNDPSDVVLKHLLGKCNILHITRYLNFKNIYEVTILLPVYSYKHLLHYFLVTLND